MGEPESFVSMNEALHEGARKEAHLDDFGDPSYRKGLEVLLTSLDEDDNLSSLGRAIYRGQLTKILATRLRTVQRLKEQPEVLERDILRPIVITGLVRTGSTALHYLMGQDPGLQKLEYWLCAEPQPRPPRDAWEGNPDFQAAVAELDFLYNTTPDLMAVHEMKADWPEECRHILAQCFTDDRFETSATLPLYNEWYHGTAHPESYRWHKKVIQLIGSTEPGSTEPDRRWLLKYPVHLRQLDALFAVYPDACVIQTHRDPRTVMASYASFISKIRRMHQQEVDLTYVAREQMESWAHAAEEGMRFRGAHGSERFFDLRFQDFMADPVGSVKRIYDRFDQTLSPEGEARMKAWRDDHPQGKHGKHSYEKSDIGIDDGEILERFSVYMGQYGLDA
ncbi:MAG: sulfotransferase [bacterium]|nr:sulfotransferase [bacterium]